MLETGYSQSALGVDFSPDGRILASSSRDGIIDFLDLATGEVVWRESFGRGNYAMIRFSPDGSHLAATLRRQLRIYDVASRQVIGTLRAPAATNISWSPQGTMIATSHRNGDVELWEVTTGRNVGTLAAHNDSVWGVDFSSDGARLATGDEAGKVVIWDVATRRMATEFSAPAAVWTLSFSPDGDVLGTAGAGTAVTLWDLSNNPSSSSVELDGHDSGSIRWIDFSPNGRLLASGGDDQTIRVWNPRTGAGVATIEGHSGRLNVICFGPDGRTLASTSNDRTVRLWEIDAEPHEGIADPRNYFIGAQFVDDRTIITGGRGKAQLLDPVTGAVVRSFSDDDNQVNSVSASADGRYIAGGGIVAG